MKQDEIANELIRRGCVVVKSPNGGLQIEQKAFWGGVSYNTKNGATNSWLNKRSWLLLLAYGVGALGMLYWYVTGRNNVLKEIRGVGV